MIIRLEIEPCDSGMEHEINRLMLTIPEKDRESIARLSLSIGLQSIFGQRRTPFDHEHDRTSPPTKGGTLNNSEREKKKPEDQRHAPENNVTIDHDPVQLVAQKNGLEAASMIVNTFRK